LPQRSQSSQRKKFKKFRESIKKNQAELANEFNVCENTITSIETGKAVPGIPIQHYLYNQYQLNINWLLTGNGEMILFPGKDSKYAVLTQPVSKIVESDPRFEKYVELNRLMHIPLIEKVILAKLEGLKLIAKEEINSFFEGGFYNFKRVPGESHFYR
jgi:DNA-binding XRE family transcriptional regulator